MTTLFVNPRISSRSGRFQDQKRVFARSKKNEIKNKMDNQTKLIKITHIVNPSRFYCYDVNAQGNELMKIKVIEKRLSDLAEKQDKCFNTFYSPQPGDVSK